jgi:hypothetical protein
MMGDGRWGENPLLGGAIESPDSIGVGHWELGVERIRHFLFLYPLPFTLTPNP